MGNEECILYFRRVHISEKDICEAGLSGLRHFRIFTDVDGL